MSIPEYSCPRFFSCDRDPTATDDETSEPVNVFPCSQWHNTTTKALFFAESVAEGAAVWKEFDFK